MRNKRGESWADTFVGPFSVGFKTYWGLTFWNNPSAYLPPIHLITRLVMFVHETVDIRSGDKIPDDDHATRTSGDVILAVGFSNLGNLLFAGAVSRRNLLNTHVAEIGDDRIDLT